MGLKDHLINKSVKSLAFFRGEKLKDKTPLKKLNFIWYLWNISWRQKLSICNIWASYYALLKWRGFSVSSSRLNTWVLCHPNSDGGIGILFVKSIYSPGYAQTSYDLKYVIDFRPISRCCGFGWTQLKGIMLTQVLS